MCFSSERTSVTNSEITIVRGVYKLEGSKIVNEIYMGDYGDILTQLKIYQRFLKYIDLSTKHDKGSPSKMPFGTDSPEYIIFPSKKFDPSRINSRRK